MRLAEKTDAELQAETGRCYLRASVGLLEHAVVLLAHVPAEELEPVEALAQRLEEAVGYLRRGEAPAAPQSATEPVPAPTGALW